METWCGKERTEFKRSYNDQVITISELIVSFKLGVFGFFTPHSNIKIILISKHLHGLYLYEMATSADQNLSYYK